MHERERRAGHAESILRAAIAAADPAPALKQALADASELHRAAAVHVIAIGKAAVRMCAATLEALPAPPASCLVVAPQGGRPHPALRCRLLTAAHPLPDASSVRAGRAVAEVLRNAALDDLILVLLSGGASAMCALPVDGLAIEEYSGATQRLMRAGASIQELNTVRRHLDLLKGGGMTALTYADMLGLIVSDVPGDDVRTIGSGPLSPDDTPIAAARDILTGYDALTDGLRSVLQNTRVTHSRAARVRTRVVLSNRDARAGAAAQARTLGYTVTDEPEPVTGIARERASDLVRRLTELDVSARQPSCLIAGGETTVNVQGSGIGGRNQELALAAALALPPDSRIAIGCVGTDGVDGASEAAGAVVDAETLERAALREVDARGALDDNDSGTFFTRVGGALRTGPTGTNVMDVIAGLTGPYR